MSSGFNLPCYTCDKPLVNPVRVDNEMHADFIRKRYKEFRSEYQLCGKCHRSILHVFDKKYKKLMKMEIEKRSKTISSSYSTDEFDTLVNRTPLSHSLRQLVKPTATHTAANVSSDKENDSTRSTSNQQNSLHIDLTDLSPSVSSVSTTSGDTAAPTVTTTTSTKPMAAASVAAPPPKRTADQLVDAPTTSTAAARLMADKYANVTKRRRIAVEPTSDSSTYDDEPSILTSRGARLPHIQPAVASRPFVHPDKRVMDIYLAGTTGG